MDNRTARNERSKARVKREIRRNGASSLLFNSDWTLIKQRGEKRGELRRLALSHPSGLQHAHREPPTIPASLINEHPVNVRNTGPILLIILP